MERRQQSEEEDEDTSSSSQEYEDAALREEKALSDSEIKVNMTMMDTRVRHLIAPPPFLDGSGF